MESGGHLALYFVLALLVSLASAQLQTVGEGSAYAVAAGSAVKLTCDGTIVMWNQQTLRKDPVVVRTPNRGFNCVGRFASLPSQCRSGVDIDRERATSITIQSVTMEDAGKYICKKADGADGIIDLTVFDASSLALLAVSSGGKVFPIAEGAQAVNRDDTIYLNCAVHFSGFSPPGLQLLMYSEEDMRNEVTGPIASTVDAEQFHPKELAETRAVLTKQNHAETAFWCSVRRFNGGVPSARFQLIDGPRFLDDTKQKTVYLQRGGVQLDCQTDSFPKARVEWSFADSDAVYLINGNGPILLAAMTGRFYCSATNTVNKQSVEKIFNVLDESAQPHPNTLSIVLPLGLIMLVIFILVFLFICKTAAGRKCCRCCFSKTPGDSQHNLTNAPPSYGNVTLDYPESEKKYAEIQDQPVYFPPTDESPPPYGSV